VVASCNSFYDVDSVNKTCIAQTRACFVADALANGVNSLEVISYKGQVVAGNVSQCLVDSCSVNFDKATDEKSCTPKTVACTLADASLVGWTVTNAATVVGNKVGNDASACVVATCQGGYVLNSLGKNCDIIPAGSISFSEDYTKNESNNVLNVTNTNAQQIQFYSDASCSLVVGTALAISSSYPINLSLVDGTKNAYAKLINGAAQSPCYSDSIVLDKTNPIITITSPSGNPGVSASTLTVTGACSDATSGILGDIIVSIDGISGTQSVACNSGSYSLSYTLPALVEGQQYTIRTEISDRALNTNSATATFVKNANQLLTVNKVGSGTVTSSPAGINCGATCSGSFSSSQTVVLTATPLTGWTFSGWSGDCTGISTCSVTMSAARNVTATFIINPSGSIAFAQDFTKLTTGNTLNVTYSNAQEIQFYTDAACSVVSGSKVAIANSFVRTVSVGNGTKVAYARFFNGIAQSPCYSDSIILDQTLPLIAISSPSGNPSIATANLTVSGTCSDANSGINGLISISIDSVASSTQTVACSSGAFSLSYVLPGTLSVGTSYTIRVSINDNATNSNSATATFIRATNRTLTISKTGTGTVSSSPAGINCGATCSVAFLSSQTVVLTATPSPGWTFSGWSGGLCSGTGTCSVPMSVDRSVTATFIETSVLTLAFSGLGSGTVSSSPSGINCSSGCSASFAKTATVILTATANASSNFVGWSGDCSGTATCSVSMSAARNVTAQFSLKPQYLITVSKIGDGSGIVSSSPAGINCGAICSSSFVEGSSITLTVTPGGLSSFVSWGGDCSGTSSTCTISNIMSAKNITANFTSNLKHNKIHLIPAASTEIATNILPIAPETPATIGGSVGTAVATNSGTGVAVSGTAPTASSSGIVINSATANLISNLNQTSYILSGIQASTIGTCNLTGSMFSSNCTITGSTFSVSFNKSQISLADSELDLNIDGNVES
jgi:hypothetical protein